MPICGRSVVRPLDKRVDDLYARFRRRVRKARNFMTAGGQANWIMGRTRGVLSIVGSRAAYNVPEDTQPGFQVELRECRVAIDLLVRKGRIDRKGLEKASPQSSALMGLLLTFLPDAVRLVRLVTRRLLLRLRAMRVHIGGLEKEGDALYRAVAEAGGGYLLCSYFYVGSMRRGVGGGPPAWKQHKERYGLEALFDCGIFSLIQQRRKAEKKGLSVEPIDMDAYADGYGDWIEAEALEPYSYVAVDVPGDPTLSRRLLVKMLRRGLRPIPVFHYHPRWREGEGWEELHWLAAQGFDVVGLGGSVGLDEAERVAWLAEVFRLVPADRQNYHGFGFCSLTAARFGFYSVDGTSHKHGRAIPSAKGTRGGQVLTDLGQRLAAAPGHKAVYYNIGYEVGLADRFSEGGVQIQLIGYVDLAVDAKVIRPVHSCTP